MLRVADAAGGLDPARKAMPQIAPGDVLTGGVGWVRVAVCTRMKRVPIARAPLFGNGLKGLGVRARCACIFKGGAQAFGLRFEGRA